MPGPNSATNRSLYTWLPCIYMSHCALGLSSREPPIDKTLANRTTECDKTARKPSETKAKDIQAVSRFGMECFPDGHYVVNQPDDRRCSCHGIVLLPFYKLPFPRPVRFALQARTRNLVLDHWPTHCTRQSDYSSIRSSRSPVARTSGHVQNLVILCSNKVVRSPSELAYWWR
ncbi:hypothetical protein EV401DRAFT_1978514 [Pisolithus croceorrhizus]|nr:hypothetical protein EV401DRAFT_1978514 [Pisolithus croceorrhizus]